jgi:hypothetical protein
MQVRFVGVEGISGKYRRIDHVRCRHTAYGTARVHDSIGIVLPPIGTVPLP